MIGVKQCHGQRNGIALIAVLWVIAFMTTLLVVTLTLLKVDVDDNVTEVHSFMAWQQAHAGLSFGLHPGVKRDDPILHSQNEFDEGFSVKIEPEARRLNINAVVTGNDKNLLVTLFKNWGMDDKESALLVDALADWVDGDDLVSLNGAESEYYREFGFNDRPYDRPFRELDELPLVRGFSLVEDLKPNWRDYFSVWSNGQIDIHEAYPEILAAAAEVEVSMAAGFLSIVAGDDGQMGTEDDLLFESINDALDDLASPGENREVISARFTLKGKVLRIESIGYSGTFRYSITAISGEKSTQVNLLDYQEKRLGSE